jgi:hypothetical protein
MSDNGFRSSDPAISLMHEQHRDPAPAEQPLPPSDPRVGVLATKLRQAMEQIEQLRDQQEVRRTAVSGLLSEVRQLKMEVKELSTKLFDERVKGALVEDFEAKAAAAKAEEDE